MSKLNLLNYYVPKRLCLWLAEKGYKTYPKHENYNTFLVRTSEDDYARIKIRMRISRLIPDEYLPCPTWKILLIDLNDKIKLLWSTNLDLIKKKLSLLRKKIV